MVSAGIWEDEVDEIITMERVEDSLTVHLRW